MLAAVAGGGRELEAEAVAAAGVALLDEVGAVFVGGGTADHLAVHREIDLHGNVRFAAVPDVASDLEARELVDGLIVLGQFARDEAAREQEQAEGNRVEGE